MNRLDALYQYESKTKYWVQEKFPGAAPAHDATHHVMSDGKVLLPKQYRNTNIWKIVAI